MTAQTNDRSMYRVLDANLNRLREALRVIEEHFRFITVQPQHAQELKDLRHQIAGMEKAIGRNNLLRSRDTGSDPFAVPAHREAMDRAGAGDVLAANLKRAQEAARVIEEFAKIAYENAAQQAKAIRFYLYAFEKKLMESETDG